MKISIFLQEISIYRYIDIFFAIPSYPQILHLLMKLLIYLQKQKIEK